MKICLMSEKMLKSLKFLHMNTDGSMILHLAYITQSNNYKWTHVKEPVGELVKEPANPLIYRPVSQSINQYGIRNLVWNRINYSCSNVKMIYLINGSYLLK